MPFDPARELVLLDAARDLLDAGWTAAAPDERTADDTVETAFFRNISLTAEVTTIAPLKGRRLILFPWAYAAVPLTRETQWRGYTLFLALVEQFAAVDSGAKSPDDAWMRERFNFFEWAFNKLANPGLTLAGSFVPALEEEAKVEVPYDRDKLSTNKTFAAWASFPFAEETTWEGEGGSTP